MSESLGARLEVGLPSAALGLLKIPLALNRGRISRVVGAKIVSVGQLWSLDATQLKRLLGDRRAAQLEAFKPKPQAGHTVA